MKITITVERDELRDILANHLRYIALENGDVAHWCHYDDALADGLGEDFYAYDGDYWSPYQAVAEAVVKEIEKCQ